MNDRAHLPIDDAVRAGVCRELVARFGARAQTGQAVREQHSHGEGLPDVGMPDIVVFPESNEEVAAIAQVCYAAGMPIMGPNDGRERAARIPQDAGGGEAHGSRWRDRQRREHFVVGRVAEPYAVAEPVP